MHYFVVQKSHVVAESDEEMGDLENETHKTGAAEEEEEPEIIESDVELDESDAVDPDNDEPQQVWLTDITLLLFCYGSCLH